MIDKEYFIKRLPSLELFYDTILHRKVRADVYSLIPKGTKVLAWFTYYRDKDVCLLMHLNRYNKIIRLFILKARQLGVSTYIEALIFAITSQMENQNATIIADDLDGSNYIFDMSKLYQEKLPDHLKVATKKSNEKGF